MKNFRIVLIGTLTFFTFNLSAQSVLFTSNNNTQPPSSSEYEVENLETINSKHLDYSPTVYRDGIVFTSTRGAGGAFTCNDPFQSGDYADLYYSQMDAEGNYTAPVLLQSSLKKRYHDGAATFNEDYTKMLFSRNNSKGTNKSGVIDLKIYQSEWVNGAWEAIKEVPFNSDDYSTCHPSLSKDGQNLYFASNRPGGQGGMDIWVSKWNGLGWGEPVNLGAQVNSNGNELFPFINENGNLYYASDGYTGKGGLDVFSVENKNGNWTNRQNLPSPINTKWDDFGFTSNANHTKGFFTSNRKGGAGRDDLYTWSFKGVQQVTANICVIDEESQDRISDANLNFNSMAAAIKSQSSGGITGATALSLTPVEIDGNTYYVFNGDAQQTPTTNAANSKSCDVQVNVTPGDVYQITVQKDGYEPWQGNVPADDLSSVPEYLIPLKKIKKPNTLTGTIVNEKTGRPLTSTPVVVVNKCTGERMEFQTDPYGNFKMDVDCNCDYEISAQKQGFNEKSSMVQSVKIDCNGTDTKTDLALTPIPKKTNPVTDDNDFKVGKVIRLDKLYYDFNKYNIRSDAAIELDKVVSLLKQYPSMEIELGSHTDSRGKDSYNEWLSRKRAESAVEYIISKGISSSRVTAAGYGETQLVNQCKNGVECSEEEHQRNRRTEIKVTQFKDENVRVEGGGK
jgi:outer membrane protein OmpA-like peptidoglycan-associated protein